MPVLLGTFQDPMGLIKPLPGDCLLWVLVLRPLSVGPGVPLEWEDLRPLNCCRRNSARLLDFLSGRQGLLLSCSPPGASLVGVRG